MNTKGLGAILILLGATAALHAQEASDDVEAASQQSEIDSLEPGFDTSAVDPAELENEREELEPAVPSAVLAQDVTRTQSGSQVMDRMELDRTEITGNQELPTVLYIVPWQKADPSDLMGRPVNTLLVEVLAPIDREEFVRQVDFYGDLYGADEEE